jgi:hypothetical protein
MKSNKSAAFFPVRASTSAKIRPGMMPLIPPPSIDNILHVAIVELLYLSDRRAGRR